VTERKERVIIDPEFKLARTYRCPKCGFEHTITKAEIVDNSTARRMWNEEMTPWYEGRFPPFLMCGKCFSAHPKRPAPQMWPVPDSSEQGGDDVLPVTHKCRNCGFKAPMPSRFPDGWKCPRCRFGDMRRKRW